MFRVLALFAWVAILLSAAAAAADEQDQHECAMYMAPSTIPGAGRGIVAGKDFDEEEVIDSAVSMTIPAHYIGSWQLQNYVYASEEDGHSMVLFGVGMLFNHLLPATVHHYWDTHEVVQTKDNKFQPSTVYSPVAHNTTTTLKRGQEIFTSYGDDAWFTDRGISLDLNKTKEDGKEDATAVATPPVLLVSEEDLAKNGHCITDIYVAKSEKTLGGFGVYASRNFSKGEIVSISPVLTLPREELEFIQYESVIQNYCIAASNSSVALFPIGYSALVNHDKNPNLVMEWYSWPNDPPGKLQGLLELPVDDLLKKEFAQLDIAFRATRDIEIHSELTMHYGAAWVEDWAEHLANQVAFDSLDAKEKELLESEDARPWFRAFIEPPATMTWPEGWRQLPKSPEEAESEATETPTGAGGEEL